MVHLAIIVMVLIISILLILLAIGAFFKFFKRDEAREQDIANMIANRRDLLNKIAEMQNTANSMQAEIDKEINRLPLQSKKAFTDKQTIVLR